jgi:hypothetical protein
MLYPQKNLIKPFTESDWFRDVTVPAPTIQVVNPYKIIMTTTMSAQGWLIWIPVELGKTYTFSFKYISGLYRIYKRKVNNHDNTMVMVQDAGAGKPDTFTFTVDSSFQGFITLRLTYGAAGVLVFENLQLEEGAIKTDFEPYKLGNKPAKLPKETINSDMSGAASHIYPYGNVISVKEDVRLWGYKIQVGTPTGTFDSVIYEWNNGAIGLPLFREVVNASASGVMNLSYKGTLLKAGKKYYIGRNDPNRNNDSTGNAGVYRKTGMPPADFKFITTLGGSQFYSPAIDFPSTWYYTFALEIEAVKQKAAILYPKDNLINPDVSKWSQGSAGGQWEMFNDNTRVRLNKRIEVLPNTKYTIKVNGNYDVYARQFSSETSFEVGISQWNADGFSFITTGSTKLIGIILRKKDNSAITLSDVAIAKPMLAQGDVSTNLPYKEINKPAKLISDGALNAPLSSDLWTLRAGTTYKRVEGNRAYWDSKQDYAGIQIMLASMGLTDSMLQGKDVVFGGEVHPMATVMLYYRRADGTPLYVGVSKVTDNGARAMTIPAGSTEHRLYVQSDTGGRGELWCENVYIKFGTEKGYKPYNPINKPAVLYPQKNLLPKMSEWTFTNAAGKVSFPSDYKLVMNGDIVGLYYNQHTVVQAGKTYTVSAGRLTENARVAIREVKANGSKVFVSNLIPTQMSYTVTPASDTVKLEVDCTTNGTGIMEFENVQLEEGKTATAFAPYVLGNKPL